MEDNNSSIHMKSKTAHVKSFLHRVSTRHETHHGSSGDGSSKRMSKTPRESLDGDDSRAFSITPDPIATASMSVLPTTASLEQSVKLFKLFEALRNADTNVLSSIMERTNESTDPMMLDGTSILHLAVQISETPMIENVLKISKDKDINTMDREGNTPLHIASLLGRTQIVKLLLDQPGINECIANYHGKTPLDLARNADVFQQLQLATSLYLESIIKTVHGLVIKNAYDQLEELFNDPRNKSTLDVNMTELAIDPLTVETGGSLLHEAARKKDVQLIEMLLLNGADPFRRDRKGKLPQDVTKDDKIKAIFKKSPAVAAAQRGIQERSILGANPTQATANNEVALGSKESREMKGYLKKWTNYTSGFKLRWFVLEDGVLSYYKQQDDAGSACRGAINMRIAKLHMDPKDKLAFDIQGKSSVKYSLKANHQVEAKRWFWALNNAIQHAKDETRVGNRKMSLHSDANNTDRIDVDKGHDASLALSPSVTSQTYTTVGAGSTVNKAMSVDHEGSTYAQSAIGDDSYKPMGRGSDNDNDHADIADHDDDYGDDHSGHEIRPANRDAFNITAQSARLQLDLLAQVSTALQVRTKEQPQLTLSDPSIGNALISYDTAVRNLRTLVVDLLRISKDHEGYWQYKLDREMHVRRLWEESMAKVAKEQEELEGKIGESEDKRRKTRRALREALEANSTPTTMSSSRVAVNASANGSGSMDSSALVEGNAKENTVNSDTQRRKTISHLTNNELSDDESEFEEEFFDAVDAGEIKVVEEMPPATNVEPLHPATVDKTAEREKDIAKSYKGYEDGPRTKLKLDSDNRPKVSLWGVLKSMIGKDMTKMTLPVSFNEPTSLLYRVAEDMEYTDLLNTAAERADPTERMLYVAAFAASEYASTVGRVAKPFNPLLGETFEYVRPDKGYRFFIEQVSHHPPVGAAYAESAKWSYCGESSVKSKFYGKSFEFNPLGTWFLRLRPDAGNAEEELYTWRKVTSSVVGIITGNPQIDNYGPMEIKNQTTGETCLLDFKARGWKANSAFIVTGRVLDRQGNVKWSIGGRWNDKIYARSTPGYEGDVVPSLDPSKPDQAFLVWEANARPTGIPFNLTPFAMTLNSLPDRLKTCIAPTDGRFRPDQRAMEDGEYDFAATEKTRVEEKQRAKRREREHAGEEFIPRWFVQDKHDVTGESYWRFKDEYWNVRDDVINGKSKWDEAGLEDIY